MPRTFMRDLAEGTEFYLLLASQAAARRSLVGRVVGSACWSSGCSGLGQRGSIWWSAPGRVRPLSPPLPVRIGARAEVLSASLGGRVVQVNFSPGQTVLQGDVLVRLDTDRLDVEMSKKRHTLANLEKEMEQLDHQEAELAKELAEASKRAEAELFASRGVGKAEEGPPGIGYPHAPVGRSHGTRGNETDSRLRADGAASRVEAEAARLKYLETKEKLLQARLPIDNQPVEIARRALRVLQDQYAGKQTDLALKRSGKLKERADTLKDLESLGLERAQAEIRAPVSGVVTHGEVKVGAILQPQQVVVEIAEQNGFVFELEVPNEDLGASASRHARPHQAGSL